jgi:hypothetical protein
MGIGTYGFRLSDVKRAVQQARELGIAVDNLTITTRNGVRIEMGPAIPKPSTAAMVVEKE